MARSAVSGGDVAQQGALGATAGEGERAAGVERAAGGRAERRRQLAGEGFELLAARFQPRHLAEQRLPVLIKLAIVAVALNIMSIWPLITSTRAGLLPL